MAIAITLKEYLDMRGVDYEVVDHERTVSALRSSAAAHIPGDQMAKSVVLGDGEHYLMAVIPATHRVDLGTLHERTGRIIGLASEEDLAMLFFDCDLGSVPPVGAAYGVDTVVDEDLLDLPTVYLESGDHSELVKLHGADFEQLFNNTPTYRCSHHI